MDTNPTPTATGNNGVGEASATSTPVSVGNSSQAQMRMTAVKALEEARAKSERESERVAEEGTKKREKEVAEVSIDTAPDYGLGETKGLNYAKVYEDLPDEGKKLIANLRADYTKKTQGLSEARKQLDADRKAMLDGGFYDKVSKEAEGFTGELDPFNSSSIEAKIQAEVAKRMKEMIEPLRQEAELNKRQIALDNFKKENPDLQEYKTDIARLLMTDKSLTLERAYWIVKGQKTTEYSRKTENELAEYKKAARDYGLKVGGANRGTAGNIPDHVRQRGAVAVYEWVSAQKK